MAIEPLRMTRFTDIDFFKRGKVRDVYDLTLKGRPSHTFKGRVLKINF